MTLEQLRIFVAVAEREHVTRAAHELNLTQSATSAAVATLETRYGVHLFDRIGRRIALTHTGRLFLIEARAVILRAEAAELALNDIAGLKRGSLTVGASQTIANYWLPSRLQDFKRRYPGITLRLRIGNTEQIAQAVVDGICELGLVEGETDHPSLDRQEIAGDSLIVVVGTAHPWAGQRKVTPRALTTTPWILREPGSGTRSMFEASLKDFGLALSDLTIALELPSNEAVRCAVESGTSATAISNLVAAASLAGKTLHKVRIALPKRSFIILRHKERYKSRVEAAFMDMIGERTARTRDASAAT
jgi:DNA-binding transcriptional LysR family regulator